MEILDDLEHLPAGAKRAALARLGTQDSAPVTAPQPDPAGMDVSAVNAWLLQHS
jgi:hypothetical protein